MDGFTFCLDKPVAPCAKPVTPNDIDEILLKSNDLKERERYWEVSKQSGPVLRPGLNGLRDLRNRVAKELGYTSYFHLQVADYGYVLETGEVVLQGTACALASNPRVVQTYLGLSGRFARATI